MNSVSLSPEVSLIHASDLPDHSVSTHLVGPGRRFITLPLSATDFRSSRSRLRHRKADSPTIPGRIEFVILRTDRSPPVAPHLASRRRSYIRLQAGERMPGEDFHLSDKRAFRRTFRPFRARTIFTKCPGVTLASLASPLAIICRAFSAPGSSFKPPTKSGRVRRIEHQH